MFRRRCHFVLLLLVASRHPSYANAVSDNDDPLPESETYCSPSDETCSESPESTMLLPKNDTSCGVYLAMSTLPGTGIGMFAGKDFQNGDALMQIGDHTIPIIDFLAHHGKTEFFLWDEYTWNARILYMENLALEENSVASPGFGAAANSFLDFVNVDEQYPTNSIPQQMHRRKDPGAGAFTYFHSRHSLATRDVKAGEELFVSYGSKWFLQRKEKLGTIPVAGDHGKADKLYRTFRRKFLEHNPEVESSNDNQNAELPSPTPHPALPHIMEEIWDSFVLKSSWTDSPTVAALPPKEDYDKMYESSLTALKQAQLTRSLDWLEKNGVCADNMYFGESMIPQAGHGAFANRPLKQGDVILPIPLIHIPDRDVLKMFDLKKEPGSLPEADLDRPRPPQLLLNYCLGHRDSTMLLSPYGPAFHVINHNQTQASVRLQWASPRRSQHNPDMFEKGPEEFVNVTFATLAMELVATKDIARGDEIFLDYGDEWEAAWQQHVSTWKPIDHAEDYISAYQMNQQFEHVFRTEFEQMKEPYPSNLMLKFHLGFEQAQVRKVFLSQNPKPLHEVRGRWFSKGSRECDILRRDRVDDRFVYAIAIPVNDDTIKEWKVLEGVPQEAIFFQDRPYTTDMFLKNAFRHDIRIPDDIFPDKWKNRKITSP